MCMLLSCATVVHADDAEIFFNKELQHVNPNVIFLLDTSGSMAFNTTDDNSAGDKPNRMDSLKDAFTAILKDKTITDIRVGVISFQSSMTFVQGLEEIDDVNTEIADRVTVNRGASSTTVTQRVMNSSGGGLENKNGARMQLSYINAQTSSDTFSALRDNFLAIRFNNILLKKTTDDTLVNSAILRLRTTGSLSNAIRPRMDPEIPSPYLTTTPSFLSTRYAASSGNISANSCVKISNTQYDCDVTSLIQKQIKQSNWEDGSAISFYIDSRGNSSYIYVNNNNLPYEPELIINLKNDSLVATNKKTYREQLIEKTLRLKANGGTNTVYALMSMSNYISDVKGTVGSKGPYHNTISPFNTDIPSPIEEGCQLTHVILMTDGQPQSNYNNSVGNYTYNTNAAKYLGYNNYNACKIITGFDSDNKPITTPEKINLLNGNGAPYSEACGRALASWMAKTDQTSTQINGSNYIKTHTIGFALDRDPNALNFLNEVATAGEGTFSQVKDTPSLVQAFKKIIADVRAADSPSASGRVTMSAQSSYKQRNEVFYALYASNAQNYWPGNMKGFLLKYIDVTLSDNTKAQRPILVGKDGTTPAMGTNGVILNTASSFWAKSKEDGGVVEEGGVRGMLDVAKRPQFTYLSGTKTSLSDVTATDLKLTGSEAEARRKGLLDFIKGYDYNLGGGLKLPTGTLKIGDSARSGVTLATYGCQSGSSVKLQDCGVLSQVALLASNDGFVRGYDTATGTVLYEYMPEEMLPLIDQLEMATIVNYDKSRFYGLDGNVVIYHNDVNGNDYMDDGDGTAYAYVVAGRGGSYIYALDISNSGPTGIAPIPVWKIKGGEGNFSRLGDTWSVPVVGNIKVDGSVIPVLVFGGGYDKKPSEEDTFATRTVSKGNAVYIVNAKTGVLIKEFTAGMSYSVPSSIALVTDDSSDHLITDIIFGDTGGQVWRFIANNIDKTSSFSGGVVATLGSGGSDSRKFFQKPSVYQYKNGTQEMISINIGSGFRNHPLSTDINDKIYSLRLPKASNGSKQLTEADLAVANIDYTNNTSNTLNGSLANGFVINLQTNGEKVITDGLAEFGRLVFNTYVPVATDRRTCKPRVGLQRTYVYDLMTGESLLETAYIESNISALPADVTYYCKGDYCTIVPSTDILSENKLPAGKDGGDSPLLTNVSGKADHSKYVKTGSTDLFDISPK